MQFFSNESVSEGVNKFPGDKLCDYPEYLSAVINIKKASALANCELGYLSEEKATAISNSCDDLLNSLKWDSLFSQTMVRFVGKPTNRAVDAAIAKVAQGQSFEVSAKELSLNQYTADLTATASAMAVFTALGSLSKALNEIALEIDKKGSEFAHVVKCGRVGLRDSLPVRLGDECNAHAKVLYQIVKELNEEREYWKVSVLGAGDLGNGLGVLPKFGETATQILAKITGRSFHYEDNALLVLNNQYRYLIAHAKIQAAATEMWKTARDLTILASGPRAGIREIVLPAVAPGSSIMPGKINPTVAELIMHVCDKVFSNSSGLSLGIHSGWLGTGSISSLPLKTILNSCQLLSRGCYVLKEKVVSGVTANVERCRQQAEKSLAFGVLLELLIGRDKTSEVLKKAYETGINVREAFEQQFGAIVPGSLEDDLFNVEVISTKEGATLFMEKLKNKLVSM